MARAGLVEIMDEMADQIRAAVVTVTDIDIQVEPRYVISATPPTIDIHPGNLFREETTAAFDDLSGGYIVTVRAYVQMTDNAAGQDLLLAFMDDTNALSIGQALYDDPTLNGRASDINITEQSGYESYPNLSGDGAYLGAHWTVLVIAANT